MPLHVPDSVLTAVMSAGDRTFARKSWREREPWAAKKLSKPTLAMTVRVSPFAFLTVSFTGLPAEAWMASSSAG